MRMGLGLGLSSSGRFNPAILFGSSTAGAFYDPSDLSSMSQNSDGTGAAAVGSPVGRILDKSGRGNHATQPTAAARPILRQDSGKYRLQDDLVDDALTASFATSLGTDCTVIYMSAAGVQTLTAQTIGTSYDVLKAEHTGRVFIINRALTLGETQQVQQWAGTA